MKVLVSGSAGFIAGYLVDELLRAGHEVVGIDNYSKYGEVRRDFDDHPGYRLVRGDAKDVALMKDLIAGCDHFVAGAAIIGGISLFHELAYDLLAENERITAAAFDAAIWAHRERRLRKISVVSSSMVFEQSWPPSSLPRARTSSTACRSRSCGRSTASASGSRGRKWTRK